jgi:hypothetical protein
MEFREGRVANKRNISPMGSTRTARILLSK